MSFVQPLLQWCIDVLTGFNDEERRHIRRQFEQHTLSWRTSHPWGRSIRYRLRSKPEPQERDVWAAWRESDWRKEPDLLQFAKAFTRLGFCDGCRTKTTLYTLVMALRHNPLSRLQHYEREIEVACKNCGLVHADLGNYRFQKLETYPPRRDWRTPKPGRVLEPDKYTKCQRLRGFGFHAYQYVKDNPPQCSYCGREDIAGFLKWVRREYRLKYDKNWSFKLAARVMLEITPEKEPWAWLEPEISEYGTLWPRYSYNEFTDRGNEFYSARITRLKLASERKGWKLNKSGKDLRARWGRSPETISEIPGSSKETIEKGGKHVVDLMGRLEIVRRQIDMQINRILEEVNINPDPTKAILNQPYLDVWMRTSTFLTNVIVRMDRIPSVDDVRQVLAAAYYYSTGMTERDVCELFSIAPATLQEWARILARAEEKGLV